MENNNVICSTFASACLEIVCWWGQKTFGTGAKYPRYATEFPSFMQQFVMLKFGNDINPLSTSSNF